MIYLRYLWYVLRHKWYVLVECWKRGLYWRGIMHDMSKFRPDEFIPYARYFYGKWVSWDILKHDPTFLSYNDTTEGVKAAFDKAWLLHQHRNPHHWQYWVLQNDTDGRYAIEMPRVYVDEMVCDWIGAGKAIKGEDNTLEWYISNRDKMILSALVRSEIEIAIGVPGTSTTVSFRGWGAR